MAQRRSPITASRRNLLAAALALPARGLHAQAKLPVVGILVWGSASGTFELEPLRHALADLGYVNGKTITLLYRYSDFSPERAAAQAHELVRLRVNVIVALATPSGAAAKAATSDIPIVVRSADALRSGFVTNLARPTGNITGFSLMLPEVTGKKFELLRSVRPGTDRMALIFSTVDPAARDFRAVASAYAKQAKFELLEAPMPSVNDCDRVFRHLVDERVQAAVIQPIFVSNEGAAKTLADAALRHHMPTLADYPTYAQAGGLMSYGSNDIASITRVAEYVGRILKGAKPADLPVMQPTVFTFVINQATAQKLDITIPPLLLAQADEVVE